MFKKVLCILFIAILVLCTACDTGTSSVPKESKSEPSSAAEVSSSTKESSDGESTSSQSVSTSSVSSEVSSVSVGSSVFEREQSYSPSDIFDAERDVVCLNISVEEAERVFGMPREDPVIVTPCDDGSEGFYREYRYAENGSYRLKTVGDRCELAFLRLYGKEISIARGIKNGDTLESVLAKFPHEQRESFEGLNYNTVTPLYGTVEAGQNYGCIEKSRYSRTVVHYYDGAVGIHFAFNEDDIVSGIMFTTRSPRTDCLRRGPDDTETERFYAQTDVTGFIDTTLEELTAIFGEPTETEFAKWAQVNGVPCYSDNFMFNDADYSCKYGPLNSSEPKVFSRDLRFYAPGVSLLRGIQVGDTAESVISKFQYVYSDERMIIDSVFYVVPLYGIEGGFSSDYGYLDWGMDGGLGENYLSITYNDRDGYYVTFLIGANNLVGGIHIELNRVGQYIEQQSQATKG